MWAARQERGSRQLRKRNIGVGRVPLIAPASRANRELQVDEKHANRWLEIGGLSISDMATSRSFDFGDARSRDLPILES